MKTTKKLTVLAICLIAAAALVTTSCEGFGKDDFYGTWATSYTYPATGATADQGANYKAENAGDNYDVTMYFSGKSENILSDPAVFYQHLIHYSGNTTTVKSETFWYGTYNLKDNTNYTEGKLVLTYIYGFTFKSGTFGDKTADDLATIALAKDAATNLKDLNPTNIAISNEKYTDVETFSFDLTKSDGAGIFAGYDTMSATEVSSWNEYTDTEVKYNGNSGCDWGVKNRKFSLTVDNGDDAAAVDDGTTSDASTSIISTGVNTNVYVEK